MAKNGLSEEAAEKVRKALMKDGDISALLCSKERLAEITEAAFAEEKTAILSQSSSQLADFLAGISVEASRAIALGRRKFLADLRKDILERVLAWQKARQEEAQKRRKTIAGTLAKKIQSHLEKECGNELAGLNEADLEKKILAAIAAGMSAGAPEQKQRVESDVKVSAPQKTSRETIIADWRAFYKKWFKIDADFSKVVIPEAEDSRPILVPKGFTIKQFLKGQEKIRRKNNSEDLNFLEAKHHRSAGKNDYAVCFPQSKGKPKYVTVPQASEKRYKGPTILEWLIYNLKFFDETGGFLKQKMWCIASPRPSASPNNPYIYSVRIGAAEYAVSCFSKSSLLNEKTCVVITAADSKKSAKKKSRAKKAKAVASPPAEPIAHTFTF